MILFGITLCEELETTFALMKKIRLKKNSFCKKELKITVRSLIIELCLFLFSELFIVGNRYSVERYGP